MGETDQRTNVKVCLNLGGNDKETSPHAVPHTYGSACCKPCFIEKVCVRRFLDIAGIQHNMNAEPNRISQAAFAESIRDLYTLSHNCVTMGGDYIEGQ